MPRRLNLLRRIAGMLPKLTDNDDRFILIFLELGNSLIQLCQGNMNRIDDVSALEFLLIPHIHNDGIASVYQHYRLLWPHALAACALVVEDNRTKRNQP